MKAPFIQKEQIPYQAKNTTPSAFRKGMDRAQNFGKTQVGPRLTNLGVFALTLIELPIPLTALVSQIGATILSAVTLGLNDRFNNLAEGSPRKNYNKTILSDIYVAAIKIKTPSFVARNEYGDGAVQLARKILERANLHSHKKVGFMQTEVLSRALYVLGIPVAVITGAVQVAFGLLAGVSSIVVPSRDLKHFAVSGLSGTNAINLIFKAFRGTINPHQVL